MKILVLNAGSSSLRCQLIKTGKTFECIYHDMVEQIGLTGKTKNHQQALQKIIKKLLAKRIIVSMKEINAVGHRVVHGGERYRQATIITPTVKAQIRKFCKLAPLHNPHNLATIIASQKLLPDIPHVAVFDTAFHETIPPKSFLYAIPYQLYKKEGLRRYGFHGTSHSYVNRIAQKLLGRKKQKIISCHLGNGSSIAAVINNICMDTSMGLTPLEGIPMGTRCGDIDPGIIDILAKKLSTDATGVINYLNHKSGIKGLSGISSDIREIWAKVDSNPRAKLTLSLLSYRIAKYIGAYSAAMNGLDAVIFTAGIGEHAYYLRSEILSYLSFLGIIIDEQKNKANKTEISSAKSRIKVYVIPTDEEQEIAYQTKKLLK